MKWRNISPFRRLSPLLAGGCAAPLPPAQPLDPGQRAPLERCREILQKRLCPDRDDYAPRVREMYAAQPPEERGAWLRDYGCSDP